METTVMGEVVDLTEAEVEAIDFMIVAMEYPVSDPNYPTLYKHKIIQAANEKLGDPTSKRWSYARNPATSVLDKVYKTMTPLEPPPTPKVIDIDHPFLTTVEAEYDRAMFAQAVIEKQRYYVLDALVGEAVK